MTCSATNCARRVIARQMCTQHYQRWKRQNPGATAPTDWGVPAIDRLLKRVVVDDESGCWVYQGQRCAGYARLRDDSGRKVFGHRLAWEHFRGPIPDGLTFDHLCENRPCVNPGHGELVSLLENVQRATKGMGVANRAKTHCPQGHPYTVGNLVASAPGRVCRECRNETNRRYRQRKAAQA